MGPGEQNKASEVLLREEYESPWGMRSSPESRKSTDIPGSPFWSSNLLEDSRGRGKGFGFGESYKFLTCTCSHKSSRIMPFNIAKLVSFLESPEIGKKNFVLAQPPTSLSAVQTHSLL